ncbi:MAG: hypothetical protein ACKVX9_19815 [Blastocatellia bacterium]
MTRSDLNRQPRAADWRGGSVMIGVEHAPRIVARLAERKVFVGLGGRSASKNGRLPADSRRPAPEPLETTT